MTIKSKMANELARKTLGDSACTMQRGRLYVVGTIAMRGFGSYVIHTRGKGKSWEAALRDAGVEIPVQAPYLPPTMPTVPSNGIADDLVTEAMGGGE